MLSQALRDPEYWKSIRRGVTDSVNRGAIGGMLGAPVDIANTTMKPFGFGADKPVMGSEWIGDKMQQFGMVSGNRNPAAEGLASFIDPAMIGAGAAKVAAYSAPLVAALGATAIGSKASEGARLSALARALKGERGIISMPLSTIPKKGIQDVIGGVLPNHPDITNLPNVSFGILKSDPNIKMKSLADGRYLVEHSPLWGSTSKSFYGIGDNLDELITAAKARLVNSDKSIAASKKIKEENSLLGKLKAEFGDSFSTAKSTQSKSEYLIHNPSGLKIRISDHNLPLHYEQPDVDLRTWQTLDEKISAIKKAME